jgi:hypothetical protein
MNTEGQSGIINLKQYKFRTEFHIKLGKHKLLQNHKYKFNIN